jgi:hypothetical protein
MIKFHNVNNHLAGELTDKNFVLNEVQDVIDLIAEISQNNCDWLILHEYNLNKDFFDLKTKFAGDVLQKFSNYRFRLAIIGDFSKYKSKSLQDFIRESNKRKMIIFVNSIDSALSGLE